MSKELDAYDSIMKRNELLEKELEYFKTKTPIVGVRWYGGGGFGIGLTTPVNGLNRVILEGYDDKAVIDFASWIRVRGTEAVNDGVLVRDDDVIKEMGITGVAAKKDQNFSPNGFIDSEIVAILKGTKKNLLSILDKVTHHFCLKHFVKVYQDFNIDDSSKLSLLRDRYRYLFSKFRWELLNKHDLRIGCENANINFEGLTEEEMVESLVKMELQTSDVVLDIE